MHFETIVNGIIFVIFFSAGSLLAYKNETDFWIVILYPTILLNSFYQLLHFFGGIFGVLYVQ